MDFKKYCKKYPDFTLEEAEKINNLFKDIELSNTRFSDKIIRFFYFSYFLFSLYIYYHYNGLFELHTFVGVFLLIGITLSYILKWFISLESGLSSYEIGKSFLLLPKVFTNEMNISTQKLSEKLVKQEFLISDFIEGLSKIWYDYPLLNLKYPLFSITSGYVRNTSITGRRRFLYNNAFHSNITFPSGTLYLSDFRLINKEYNNIKKILNIVILVILISFILVYLITKSFQIETLYFSIGISILVAILIITIFYFSGKPLSSKYQNIIHKNGFFTILNSEKLNLSDDFLGVISNFTEKYKDRYYELYIKGSSIYIKLDITKTYDSDLVLPNHEVFVLYYLEIKNLLQLAEDLKPFYNGTKSILKQNDKT